MAISQNQIDFRSGLIGFLLCLAIGLPIVVSFLGARLSPSRQRTAHVQAITNSVAVKKTVPARRKIHPLLSPAPQDRPCVLPVQDGVWRTVDPGGSGGTIAHAMHPLTGTVLVSSDMYHSLLRSKDNAASFQAISPPGHPSLAPLVPHPGIPGVWYAGYTLSQANGLARSDDDGMTWTLVNQAMGGFSTRSIGVALPDGALIWEFGKKGLMISHDNGNSFSRFNEGLSLKNMFGTYAASSGKSPMVEALPETGRILYLACRDGLYRRGCEDAKWRPVEALPRQPVTSVAYDPYENLVWAGYGSGEIFHAKAGSGQWIKTAQGPPSATILRTHPLKPGWVWCFSHGRAGLFRSTDQGQHWTWLTRKIQYDGKGYTGNVPPSFRSRTKFIRDAFFISPENPEHLSLGQIYRSLDGGKTWQFGATRFFPETSTWHGNGLTLLTGYRAWFDPIDPNRVYLGFSDTGLMRSDDRGYSVKALWKEKFPDLYPLAYWKNKLLNTSGSCMAFAVDPEFPQTQYYGMSCKGDSTTACGMLFKTDHDGQYWHPVFSGSHTLPNGIITDLTLLPGNGFSHRKLYALVNWQSRELGKTSGVFLSHDMGNSFQPLAISGESVLTFPLMNLDYCQDRPKTMYIASSTRGGKRPAKKLRQHHDNSGGIFKSIDSGSTWQKTGGPELAGAVQVAVHPNNPDTAYAAVVGGKGEKGGIYKTTDGGKHWRQVLDGAKWLPPERQGQTVTPTTVAINPALPRIVYAAINHAGVFRSIDSGQTWEQVDWPRLKKYQGVYHTLSINPHDPAEFYLALFGNSFLAYRDPVAADLIRPHLAAQNHVRNGNFENTGPGGRPVHWQWQNPVLPTGPAKESVLSIHPSPYGSGNALRIRIKSPNHKNPGLPKGQDTAAWVSTRLTPASTAGTLNKTVNVGFDIYVEKAKLLDLPVLALTCRTKGSLKILKEIPASLAFHQRPYETLRISSGDTRSGKWMHIDSSATIPKDARAVGLTFFLANRFQEQLFFIDNVRLFFHDQI